MTFDIAAQSYIWWPWLVLGGLVLALVVMGVGGLLVDSGDVAGAGFGLAFASLFAGSLLTGGVIIPSMMDAALLPEIKSGLTSLGFEDVTVEGVDKSFTASLDGAYFAGMLLKIDDNTYQIAEVVK